MILMLNVNLRVFKSWFF